MKNQKSIEVFRLFALVLILATQYSILTNAQVAISDTAREPAPSAVLELYSESKGFLPPRLTTAQIDSIANPAVGLVVYDTDKNRLLYFYNVWKDLGLWSSDSLDIYYSPGKVAIGPGSDTSQFNATLNITGKRGIYASVVSDDDSPAYEFSDTMSDEGDFHTNFLINTYKEGNPSMVSVGLYSYMQGNDTFTVGLGGQSFYSGAGGDWNDLNKMPTVAGMWGDNYVLDTNAIAVAIGAVGTSGTSHKGINVGLHGAAASESTYANLGGIFIANEGMDPLEILRDSFPARFTASSVLYNSESSANDYNLFAMGNAPSYFGGKVGIGKISPASKLDVAGAVNATAYLINGDTLGGVWSRSGNDIYYDEGKVHVGGVMPSQYAATLNVTGSTIMVSDTAPSLPAAYFSFNSSHYPFNDDWGFDSASARLWFGVADTFSASADTQGTFFGMGRGKGMLSAWGSFKSSNDSMREINLISLGYSEQEFVEDTSCIFMASGMIEGSKSLVFLSKNVFAAGYGDNFIGNFIGANDSIAIMAASAEDFSYEGGFPSLSGSSVTLDTLSIVLKTKVGSDSSSAVLTSAGFGINTDDPDTELEVNGDIKQKVTTAGFTVLTASELNSIFGSASSKGDGWTAYLKNTNTGGGFYQVMAYNSQWYAFTATPIN